MVEISISVALDSAAMFLTFRQLSGENRSVTILLGTPLPSPLALSVVPNASSRSSCGKLLLYQNILEWTKR